MDAPATMWISGDRFDGVGDVRLSVYRTPVYYDLVAQMQNDLNRAVIKVERETSARLTFTGEQAARVYGVVSSAPHDASVVVGGHAFDGYVRECVSHPNFGEPCVEVSVDSVEYDTEDGSSIAARANV